MPEIFEQACAERLYEITADDLPLSCPTDHMRVWDAHPRVYLPLVNNTATCPYCSAQFILKEKTS